jgi:hypothetical protein
MAPDNDDEPTEDWKSSLWELADRIRNEKPTARTAESTPASRWSPNIRIEERPDKEITASDTDASEFGYRALGNHSETEPSKVDSVRDTHASENQDPAQKDPPLDASDTDQNTHTDQSVPQDGEKQSDSDDDGEQTKRDTVSDPRTDISGTTGQDTNETIDSNSVSDTDSSESVVEALGDVQIVSDGEHGDATTAAGTDPNSADTDKTESGSLFDDETAVDPSEPDANSASLKDLGPDRPSEGQSTDDEKLSLGNISSPEETPSGETSDTAVDSESAERHTSGQAETDTSNQMGSNTFGELADRIAASRENQASSRADQDGEDNATETADTESADVSPQPSGSDRQLPLGANEPEFTTDLAPLVKPNMSAMLLGALKSNPVDQACGKLLTFPNEADYNLLLVTVTQSAEDRLLTVYENSGHLPENIGIVAIDNNVSAQSTVQTVPIGGVDRTVHMKTATDPGDIKGIGIRISKQLSEWDDNDRPTMVCFHSLTSILQYISTKQLFQFIHLLQNRLRSYDAVVHYHIDPSVHDKMTLSQIKPLLDHVIEVENDGTCWIE